MRRLLLLLSIFSLCLLAYGTAFHPDFAAFWLASNDPFTQTIRILLSTALFIQLVTQPPRNIYFRILCGLIAGCSASWVFQQSASYHMMYLDSLSILSASIATSITALEISYEKEEHTTSKHVFVS